MFMFVLLYEAEKNKHVRGQDDHRTSTEGKFEIFVQCRIFPCSGEDHFPAHTHWSSVWLPLGGERTSCVQVSGS